MMISHIYYLNWTNKNCLHFFPSPISENSKMATTDMYKSGFRYIIIIK